MRSRAATTETQYSEDTKTSNGMIPSPKARQLRPTRRDTSDCTLLDRYDTDESVVLGRGAWGKVYKLHDAEIVTRFVQSRETAVKNLENVKKDAHNASYARCDALSPSRKKDDAAI